jgi:hypothetical protein
MENTLQHKPTYKVTIIFAIIFVLFKYLHARYNFNLYFVATFSYGMYIILFLWAIKTQDELLKKILIFGIFAGIVELISDWWLVDYQKSLVYPLDEPRIWASPLYMPFAWAVIFVQIGIASLFAQEKWGNKWTIVIAIILGAVFVPFFEYWAKIEGWWFYQNCKMLFDAVPYYIILSEALLCAVLPFWIAQMDKKGYGFAILAGCLQGLWIWITCIFAFYLTR